MDVVRRESYTLKKQDVLLQGAAKGLENQGEALEKETRRQGRVVEQKRAARCWRQAETLRRMIEKTKYAH